jgi:hypothetical protein
MVSGGEERSVERNDITISEELVLGHIFDAWGGFKGCILVDVEAKDVATKATSDVDQALTNLTCTDDTEGLAVHVESNEAVEREVVVAGSVDGLVDLSVEGHNQSNGVLGDGVGGVSRDTSNAEAKLGGSLEVKVIVASATHSNKLDTQLRELLNDLSADDVINETADNLVSPGCLNSRTAKQGERNVSSLKSESAIEVGKNRTRGSTNVRGKSILEPSNLKLVLAVRLLKGLTHVSLAVKESNSNTGSLTANLGTYLVDNMRASTELFAEEGNNGIVESRVIGNKRAEGFVVNLKDNSFLGNLETTNRLV